MRHGLLAALALILGLGNASAADPAAPRTLQTANDLVRMNRCDLEALYRACSIGCPPNGIVRGRAIINPGSRTTVAKSRIVGLLWQGKVVTEDRMVNRVLGLRVVPARVYVGDSWLDGKPSLIMDYEGTSRMFGEYRDEVRQVSQGLWLGLTHKRTGNGAVLKVFFALESRKK